MNEAADTFLTPEIAFNTALAARLRSGPDVDVQLGGSLYAVPPSHRAAVAHALAEQSIWVHADVFADGRTGVSVELIEPLADEGVGPLDIHLLTAGALDALDAVCRPGIARVTFPFEDVPSPEKVAATIRAAGARPWLAISPTTTLDECAEVLPHVDGLLVMLLQPGTSGCSDPAMLAKVNRASASTPVGVDGGVGESNIADVLAAGATYIVIGRRLFALAGSAADEVRP